MVKIDRIPIPTGTECLPLAFKKITYGRRNYNFVKLFDRYDFTNPKFQKYYTDKTGKIWLFPIGENKRTAQKFAVYRKVLQK